MKTTFRSFALPTVLVFLIFSNTLPMPGCDKKRALAEAAEAAKDIGGGTRDVIAAVGKAYDQKLISFEQKNRLADLLIAIAKGGQKGVAALDTLEKSGVTELSGDQRSVLNKLFDVEVIDPFLTLISEIAKLSDESQTAIRIALASVRTAILLFSNKIGRIDIRRLIETQEAEQYV